MSDGSAQSSDEQPSDTMRGRLDDSRVKLWFLMNGDRWVVTALIAAVFFSGLIGVARLDPPSIRLLIANKNVLWWVFSPMIGAIVTGVTLVITISQLILSQELGALGDQRERMEGAMEFRTDVESWLDNSISPPDPASFMEALLDSVQTHANDLADRVSDSPDDSLREEVDEYVDGLLDNAERVGAGLSDAQFGEFDVVYSALDFNYSWKIYQGRRIIKRHEDGLDEEVRDSLEDIVRLLRFFGPAREHFKTLYFQWELVNLSRIMLLAAVPALFVAISVQLFVNAALFPGATFGVENLTWFLAACVTLTSLPFLILLSYVVRVATITKRTLAIGSFILRDTERSDDISWD